MAKPTAWSKFKALHEILPGGSPGTDAWTPEGDGSRIAPRHLMIWPRSSSMRYSMIWSARPSNDGGIVRRSALAVLRLMTNSNLVGCSIGRSPGFAPLRILST
jgi:hypothetical protein